MFLMRLLVLILIVAVLLWLLKRMFGATPDPRLESGKAENMKQCKYCGVHVPESSIVTAGDETYCCQEHAELDRE